MTKNLPLVASFLLNVLLGLWLVNNYFYDQPFRDYVQLTFGQIYPFLILTMGVGGGSGLGYLFLKRKQQQPRRPGELKFTGRLARGRFPHPGVSLGSTASSSSTGGKAIPATGSPSTTGTPGQIPRQVAYQVPPPISAKSGKSGPTTSSWSGGMKTAGSTSTQSQPSTPQLLRREAPPTPTSVLPPQRNEMAPPPIPSNPNVSTRPVGQPWRQEPTGNNDRQSDQERPVIKPGLEFGGKPQQPPPPSQMIPRLPPNDGPISRQVPGGMIPPVPQKWQPPPSQTSSTPPGNSPGQPRLDFDPSQKWAPVKPPYTTSTPQQQTHPNPVPPAQQLQPRQYPPPGPPGPMGQMRPPPAPGPFAVRPLPPTTPRPLPPTFQPQQAGGQPRPGPLAPVGVARQFPPSPQNRPVTPPPGPSGLPYPPRPSTPPQQWTGQTNTALPQGVPAEQRQQPPSRPGSLDPKPTLGTTRSEPRPSEQLPPTQSPEKQPPQGKTSQESGGGAPAEGGSDMDWDTALDTILKTLRRDRIRDEQ